MCQLFWQQSNAQLTLVTEDFVAMNRDIVIFSSHVREFDALPRHITAIKIKEYMYFKSIINT